jgi:hypothetical protein
VSEDRKRIVIRTVDEFEAYAATLNDEELAALDEFLAEAELLGDKAAGLGIRVFPKGGGFQ